MLECTFLEDWDEIGTKMTKKDYLLPKSRRLIHLPYEKGYFVQLRYLFTK